MTMLNKLSYGWFWQIYNLILIFQDSKEIKELDFSNLNELVF